MALESRVDGERTGSGVHAGDVLSVVNLAQTQLGAVVPVMVVEMLSNESVRLYREVLVDLQTKT